MIAVIPVRDGVLPIGADEAAAECDGNALIVGSGTSDIDCTGLATDVSLLELGDLRFGSWATILGEVLPSLRSSDIIVVPNSPDGRDLAPRLAFELDRPLYAGATRITADVVHVARAGGRELHQHHPVGQFVATLQPGVRGTIPFTQQARVTVLDVPSIEVTGDAVVVEVLPADVGTMDLAEARRIVGGGAGLDSEERFTQLARVAARVGATLGATRVVTDRSWVHHDKQIGTTGVVVDPDLYVSFGVSGAVQHTAGLGAPDHIISVNTDPHCPMMTMSDLAIVSDANATLDELITLLDANDVNGANDKPSVGEGRA